jgi:hypothetical protein
MTRHALDIVAAMNSPKLFAPFFHGPSWDHWRTVLRAAYALPLTDSERAFFRTIAERDPPRRRVRELWIIAGRRAGKDSIASVIAAHTAALFNDRGSLRRGERALVACLACDRDQAKIVHGYTASYFDDIPSLHAMVRRRTSTGFELSNGVDIAIATNSFRSIRGRPILAAVFDECAFWRDETSAAPDEETYTAVKPGMATLRDAMLVGISTPYRKAGLLYRKFRDHYGEADDDVLVVRAPSLVLNPTLDQAAIDRAFADDPAEAAAEWYGEWRTDVAAYVDRAVIEGCVEPNRRELPPVSGVRYHVYVDPAGGSGSDSMTIAVSHRDKDGNVVLDAARERRPPFSPDDVVVEFAELAKAYHARKLIGDHWGGEFVRQPFRARGLDYELSPKTTSDTYRDTLPIFNSGKAKLYDLPRLIAQLCNLERTTARSGKDTISHPKRQHDDLANAACGALLLASEKVSINSLITPAVLAQAARPTPQSRRRLLTPVDRTPRPLLGTCGLAYAKRRI